ncbi:hypothetical protein [Enterobacter hormaechei]|uniref:Uncharacterized protein n=2 Tax=Enterobacter hormaechei TaxID=158836 RepID=A0A9Q2ZST1_9ENTR|nr:hypothetical protein [Enterobacter hormaechei]MBT1778729.1 hypothetical protein [Enterobacter hormaechei subsp. hoffmannii]ELE6461097.1 hypothetical protein [Enterobacter hormaechei]MBT1854058.1 hypothetical protein [Enterobacter hormaechei subsp. hoffmannii]MCE1268443.1 hypothetical protein [Enterobacter hormaechei]MCE1280600.1 hypothetical protein [Enterobacter hormaechei]
MLIKLLKQALCLWVVIAIAYSGMEFCLFISKSFPSASNVITWAGGIAASVIGIFAGMAAWKGFGLSEY